MIKNQNLISIGSKVTYCIKKSGMIAEKKIVAARFEEKPCKGTGAYYDLETRREVIPPDITKHEISSESSFAKQIMGHQVGAIITIKPDNAKPYVVEIIQVENE